MKRSSQSHMSVHTPPIGSVHLRPATRSCIARACRGARACFSPRSQRSCAAILLPAQGPSRPVSRTDERWDIHLVSVVVSKAGTSPSSARSRSFGWGLHERTRERPSGSRPTHDMPKVLEQHRKGRGMQVRSLDPHICAIFYFIY